MCISVCVCVCVCERWNDGWASENYGLDKRMILGEKSVYMSVSKTVVMVWLDES